MARQLTSVPNTDAGNAAYPSGKIRNDNPPTAAGTPVVEELYGDIIQFFHKLVRLAGITHNDFPENETYGFQFIEALAYYVRTLAATQSAKGTIEIASNDEVLGGTDALRAVTPAGLKVVTDIVQSTAASDATSKANAAIAAAAVDATSKANAALSSAQTYALTTVSGGLFKKVVEIGDWNMDSTNQILKAHALNFTKIRKIDVFIIEDSSNNVYSLLNSGKISYNSTNVVLTRDTGGDFDSIGFDSTSFNRGYITIDYVL